MQQTNYQLFDFLDFSTALDSGDRLWRACTPTEIEVKNGDVFITIPFQKQQNSNEINPDTSAPRKNYMLRLRAYGQQIVRAAIGFGTEWKEDSPMLELDARLTSNPLHVEKTAQEWIVRDSHNQTKANVSFRQPEISWWSDLVPAPAETIDLTLFPDGVHEVKFSAYDMFSPARHDAFALALVERNDVPNRVTCSLKAKADECFAGTGERFAKMDLSGRTFQLRNQDGQGVNNRRAYKNIPFYLSSEHYGLFLHTSSFAKFSLADHSTRSAQVLVEEPVLDLFFIGGDTAEQILFGYRQLTGFPTMPPLWSFGTWMSRMTYFSADEVNDICQRMRNEGYPCDVIHLDTGWFKTDWLCEWKFNDERFSDPKKFIADLKKDGYRVSLWQLPYISYNAEQYEEANANDYISKSERKISGSSNFSMEDYAGTIDFTYDKATEWYKGLLKKLLDMGVVCIKTDFGEDIHLDAEYHSMTPEKLHNLYPLLYQKAAYEITKEVAGEGIVWARAGWAGCQRYPLHWGGDSACSWDGLAGSLKGGLHIGLSGFGFWSHDVPGFHGVPNFMNSVLPDDIYVRWTQFGVFSSHLRYHGSHEREPWHYPAIAPIVKKWLQLRYRLIPYILEQSEKVTHTGYPVLRALLFHHPEDKTCWHIEDQYYFGDNMLVAPVMNSDNRRDIYLPEGKWVNFFTGEILEGERWLRNVEVPLDQMPVYVKYSAEIPVYPENVNCTDEMDMAKVVKIRFDEKTKCTL
ncbi:glycoside hydrolase family 31 protein [Paludibacter jiangxiensis]|uniref:Alpha-D-xyloside xylohydrolase n=1 Tax=Paludibacter jiangxiensis TaxID=681398 RepID=A0A170Z0J9_9BACT|nr:alpha-xylosidase [Paludibacter jiangxiensis]GAT62232.1 alpha-D-xyloside xylohydrolase [Paludibacter jiangxiensis]